MAQRRAVVDIPATVHGPHGARRVVSAVLEAWGRNDLIGDAQLLISELVTNAVQHAPAADILELELVERATGVRIILADGSAIRPIVAQLSDDAPSGRGMRIVEAIAQSWGADEHKDGKRVWVDLHATN